MEYSGKSNTLAILLLVSVTLLGSSASGAHAVCIINKLTLSLTVFYPPYCAPCECPVINCIKAPCEQPRCVCTKECRLSPGVDVEAGKNVTLTILEKYFPLPYLKVTVDGKSYGVTAKEDLKYVSAEATVVISSICGGSNKGLQAFVYLNGKIDAAFCLYLM